MKKRAVVALAEVRGGAKGAEPIVCRSATHFHSQRMEPMLDEFPQGGVAGLLRGAAYCRS